MQDVEPDNIKPEDVLGEADIAIIYNKDGQHQIYTGALIRQALDALYSESETVIFVVNAFSPYVRLIK